MQANMMNAIRSTSSVVPRYCSMRKHQPPELKAGEVLVRVHAVGINHPDLYLRDGYKMLPPEWQPHVAMPLILGTDISGVIEAFAEDVTGFAVGEDVYSMVKFPSGLAGDSRADAEYVSVPSSQIARKPAGIDHVHAAGAPMALLTAWQFLIEQGHSEPNPLQPDQHKPLPLVGKTVLVNGAAGGVGHFAVQLAKWKGAHVITVASGKHEAILRDLGADEFIDYTTTPPETVVHDVDLVLDAVDGPAASRFLKTLKRGGALFPVFPLGFNGGEEAAKLGVTVSATQVQSSGAQLEEVGRLLDAGTLRVVIDSTFPFAEARTAHERAGQGHIQGKLALTVA